jgi:hypothetical protein
MREPGGELMRTSIPITPVDNEDIGLDVQTPSVPELVFHALLIHDDAQRLELARA